MGVSRPENVDRADQIGVFLETAFDAQKPGLRLAVVRQLLALKDEIDQAREKIAKKEAKAKSQAKDTADEDGEGERE